MASVNNDQGADAAEHLALIAATRCRDPSEFARFESALRSAGQRFDWGRFLDAAVRHNVTALVGRNLRAAKVSQLLADGIRLVPRGHYSLLVDSYDTTSLRNESMLEELKVVVDALRGDDIAFVIGKGLPLAALIDGDLGVRQIVDIDILCARSSVGGVMARLRELGYAPGRPTSAQGEVSPFPDDLRRLLLVSANIPPFQRVTGQRLYRYANIGLTMRVFPPRIGRTYPVERVLERAELLDIGDASVPIPCRSDFYIDMCAQFFKECKSITGIVWGRDVSLAKIWALSQFRQLLSDEQLDAVRAAASEFDLFDVIAFAETWIATVYPLPSFAPTVGAADPAVMQTFGETEGERFAWSQTDLLRRLFDPLRIHDAPGPSAIAQLMEQRA